MFFDIFIIDGTILYIILLWWYLRIALLQTSDELNWITSLPSETHFQTPSSVSSEPPAQNEWICIPEKFDFMRSVAKSQIWLQGTFWQICLESCKQNVTTFYLRGGQLFLTRGPHWKQKWSMQASISAMWTYFIWLLRENWLSTVHFIKTNYLKRYVKFWSLVCCISLKNVHGPH